jgi:hypothetical protein
MDHYRMRHLLPFLGLKYLNLNKLNSLRRIRDPEGKKLGSGIRYGKNKDPGFGINIPDPQHCIEEHMFIPDPGSDFFPSRIRTVSIPDPGSSSKNLGILTPKKAKIWFLSSKKYDPGCLSGIPDPDADFLPSRIRGSKMIHASDYWIRIRILDPDPAIFVIDLQDGSFEGAFTLFFKDKMSKKSQNNRIQGFSYYFCMMMEGSGSIPVTSGYGSGRPKNTWIRWILIRIRIRNTERINRPKTVLRNWPIDRNLSNPSPPPLCHFTLPRKITTVYQFLIIVVFYLNI